MQSLIMYKQMKNGKWRLYKSVQQAITAWRGTNDKVTTVREERHDKGNYGEILNFSTKQEAIDYARTVLGRSAYDWCE